MSEDKYTAETVLSLRYWTPNLLSFSLTRPAHFRFTAGQFARLGLGPVHLNKNLETTSLNATGLDAISLDAASLENTVFRAYSIVSSPFAPTLDFFSILVPNGAFSDRLKHIKCGDLILLDKTAFGFLTLARFQAPLPNTLWLLATGTGLAPFLSILQDFEVWEKYQQIILVYSVRTPVELAYQTELKDILNQFGSDTVYFKFVPVVTRKPEDIFTLSQRIPALIDNGQLEQQAEHAFNAATDHILLCGNPQMIEDTRHALMRKGLTMNRRGVGNIAVENYW